MGVKNLEASYEDFGLSKHKIDEIILWSVKRFGDINDEWMQLGAHEADKSADFFEWLKDAGNQARDSFNRLWNTHGDKVKPLFLLHWKV